MPQTNLSLRRIHSKSKDKENFEGYLTRRRRPSSPNSLSSSKKWYVERPYPAIDDPDIAKAVLHSKSCSHVSPEDWLDSTKYDPITQEIFASWIPVHDILLKKKGSIRTTATTEDEEIQN
jgi:hypothetical protein